jgi:hypothetical protein
MMEETGSFEEYLNRIGEVNVEWFWCEGDDWELSGEFDLVVTQGDIEVTNDLNKSRIQLLVAMHKRAHRLRTRHQTRRKGLQLTP